ncbi:MAG TPA: GlsB/YeaQ/YmgE family stress response membrane protein [Acidimicrobiales bacterium]|jgi:uncharacterized membrane protein YeaQ/YmgE (transglycosylase-associated protein family)|nr:GlsB/YeaQ/YmgE family stress response membrane protein [Acidimicrobiales bacterium]
MFWHILWWFIIGLIAGGLARMFVRGKHRLGIMGTAVLGIIGSFVGGFLGFLLFNVDSNDGAVQPAGIFGSVVGAMIILWLWGKLDSSRSPARRRR